MGRIGRSFQLVAQSYRIHAGQGTDGPAAAVGRQSFRQSLTVFKRTWGETVVGGISLSAAAMCAWLTLVAVVGLLAMVIGFGALVVFGIGAIGLGIFFSALQGVYVASLYRYATGSRAASGFDQTLFDQAFVPKKR